MTRWGMFIDLNICAGCASCVMACRQSNGTPYGVFWCNVSKKEEGRYPDVALRVLPMGCMHCENAPCVRVCPTGASYHREDGLVLINSERCIGCRFCESACSYGARHYNDPEVCQRPYWGDDFEPTPYELVKTRKRNEIGKMGKCTFCVERLDAGKDPMCVHTCPTRCRVFGDLDDPDSEVNRAIAKYGAKPLNPEYGTSPSVYYSGSF